MTTIDARTPYPSDVTDEEWAFVAPYLTLMRDDAPQRDHDLRAVFNGLRWVVRTGSQAPICTKHYMSDAALEALNAALEHNPDELLGWVKAADAYRSGRGGDREAYLSLWAGTAVNKGRRHS